MEWRSAAANPSHGSRAVYAALKVASLSVGELPAATALPLIPPHERLIRPIMPALTECSIGIFWVDQDISVTLEAPWPI